MYTSRMENKMDFKNRVGRKIRQVHDGERCRPNAMGYCSCPNEIVTDLNEADVITSELNHRSKMHMPVIDLDFPCQLVESATPGHFHLYLDKGVYLEDFMRVLEAMAEAGLVEWGYYDASKSRGYSAVRHPDRPKSILGESTTKTSIGNNL